MNKFIKAIKDLDIPTIEGLLKNEPKWITWAEDTGKNGQHYLCGVDISKTPKNAEASLDMLKLFLKSGMDINAIHKIPDSCGIFPATPLWYAYTRGEMKNFSTIF